eukprot:scaffold19879_cov174-Amphora_coffeaeformis.AAC.1
MPSSKYEESDDEFTLEDDEETISVCSSVISEETLDIVPPRIARRSHRRGLTRSDGREAVLGLRPSSFRNAEPGQTLLASPRARELKRRRPVNNSSTQSSLPTVTLVSEDSLNEMADQAPSCPRREKSRDGESWPTLEPTQSTSAGSCLLHAKDEIR